MRQRGTERSRAITTPERRRCPYGSGMPVIPVTTAALVAPADAAPELKRAGLTWCAASPAVQGGEDVNECAAQQG